MSQPQISLNDRFDLEKSPVLLNGTQALVRLMLMQAARDTYTRRQEGVSIWLVRSEHIHASQPEDGGAFFDPSEDKVYRHPTFYDVPDELKL